MTAHNFVRIWGIMANPVLAEYQRLTEFINKENTSFA